MVNDIIEFFRSFTGNDYLTLYLISMIPIIELRGAILFMPAMFDSVGEMIAGMFCCAAGSATVVIPLILITRPLLNRLKKTKTFSKIAKKLESALADRAESAYSEEKELKKEEKRKKRAENGKKERKPLSTDAKKFLGLFTFVAIPLPLTGGWTGAFIGSFLEMPVWKAALSVVTGNIVAGAILTVIAVFMPTQYVDLFLYGFVILAIALAVILFFARSKRAEKRRQEALEKYGGKDAYELELLKKEADENGEILIKKEYIDENGDKHIIIGRDQSRNEKIVDDDKLI